MPPIGERLRLEREKQRRTVTDIANSTCISSRYISAIEADDRKTLPGDFFYRNFVKQYAAALGLDPDPLIREVDSTLPKHDDDVLPVLSASYTPAGKTQVRNRSKAVVSFVLLVFALAGGSALYAWWDRSQRKDLADIPHTVQAQAETKKAPAIVPSQPQSQIPVQEPAPAAQAPQPAASEERPAVPASGTVKLAATEPTWVSVSSAGKTIFSGILKPAQTRSFEGIETAKLITGNAGGLDVEWNGKAIGPIGPRGQKRLVLFTRESFQIVPPNAPPPGL